MQVSTCNPQDRWSFAGPPCQLLKKRTANCCVGKKRWIFCWATNSWIIMVLRMAYFKTGWEGELPGSWACWHPFNSVSEEPTTNVEGNACDRALFWGSMFLFRDSLFSHVFGAFRQTKVALWGSQAYSGKIRERSVYIHVYTIYIYIHIYIL